MFRPRCIFTDLDGTLFGPDATISPRTIAALEAADEAGVTVVAVTGRSHRTAAPRLVSAPTIRTALCSNGAVRYDITNDKVVHATMLSQARVHDLLNIIESEVPGVGFGWETLEGFWFEEGFAQPPEDLANDPRPRRGPQHRDAIVEAVKVYIAHPELTDVALQRAFAPLLPSDIAASTSGVSFIEATDITATKGAAVAAFAGEMNWSPEEVVAIGDQMNDMTMLTWAGHGIAMGNAVPDIKAIADHITAPNTIDGAAQAIEYLITLPIR